MPEYWNDPREMIVRPESGVTLEQDNRVETMYHWGAMVVDLCDLPVSEYMKSGLVVECGTGGTGTTTTVTVTFIDQYGKRYVVRNVPEGTIISEIIPDVEGHTFTVPDDVANSEVGTKDMTVNGTITPNNYKVSITVDGELSEIKELPYGTDVEAFINDTFPADEGYHIVIETTSETVPADDSLVVVVTYEPNDYKLTFRTPDEVISSTTVKFGETIVYPVMEPYTDESGTAFTFVWDDLSYSRQTMPAHDVEITGKYMADNTMYFGSFVTTDSEFTPENVNSYFDENAFNDGVTYGKVGVSECSGDGKTITDTVQAYEPLVGLNIVRYSTQRRSYHSPLVFLMPTEVEDGSTISLTDPAGIDYWPETVKSSAPLTIGGKTYYMHVLSTKHTRPGKSAQDYEFIIRIKKN